MMNRREFLKLVAGAGLAAPALLGPSGCATIAPPEFADTGLSLYCLTGDVTEKDALVWLRAEPDSLVTVQYGKDPHLTDYDATQLFSVDPAADHTVKIRLDDLQPASRYYYRAAVSGKTPGPIGSFVTAPRPDDDRKVSFCFSGDTRESYKPFTVMSAVRAHLPDFFIHLGDTIYADRNGTAYRLPEFWAKYRNNRDDLATQYCLRDVSIYVMWDDHEVHDDYAPEYALAPIGQKAFLDYWPVCCPVGEPKRIFRSFRWGRALEVFMLDGRQYRDRKHSTMLGAMQKEWLLDSLARSSATFKFVATPVPMAGGGSDRWDGFSRERAEILAFIKDHKIHGVVFLSADLHYAAITKIPKSGGLRDITAGPLAAPLNRITDGTAKRFEFFLAENFNFAKITVDPKADRESALLEFIDQDNRVFHSAKLRAA